MIFLDIVNLCLTYYLNLIEGIILLKMITKVNNAGWINPTLIYMHLLDILRFAKLNFRESTHLGGT